MTTNPATKIHMPIKINFNAPINLTYNGAENQPLEKVNSATDKPASDTAPKTAAPANDKPATSTSCGVAAVSIDDLADSLVDQIDKYFDNLYQKIKEVGDPSSARAVARQREVIRDAFINLITTGRESLETHLRFVQIRKNSF